MNIFDTHALKSSVPTTLLCTHDGSTRMVGPGELVRVYPATWDHEDGNTVVLFEGTEWLLEHRRDWQLVNLTTRWDWIG